MMPNFIQLTLALLLLFYPCISVCTSYHSLGDIFEGQLANLTTAYRESPYLGGQDFYRCCLIAVNESLTITDGNLEFRPGQTFLHGNISTFLEFQFPCSASYDGHPGDQPQVTIPYSWCHQTCPGWSRTKEDALSDWVQPLIAFILPTIVFCFTIPRRRRLHVPDWMFPHASFLSFPRNLTLLYKFPATILFLIFDSLLWVSTSVVVAGPMLLSGCLEGLLDLRVLNFLASPELSSHLSVKERLHLLLIVLIGNLDLDPAWDESKAFVARLPAHVLIKNDGNATKTPGDSSSEEHDNLTEAPGAEAPSSLEAPITTQSRHAHTKVAKSQLIALLESQLSFGASVGIGVVFYVSSFFYSIMEIRSSYGDS